MDRMPENPRKKMEGFIRVLLDRTIRDDIRDDAAMDLDAFADPAVLKALILVASDPTDDDLVLNSCGESIGTIWANLDSFDKEQYQQLSPVARYGLYVVVRAMKPEWIDRYNLSDDPFEQ